MIKNTKGGPPFTGRDRHMSKNYGRERADIKTEEKFNEVTGKLREKFIIFGTALPLFDPEGDYYLTVFIKEADGFAQGFKVSREWFDERDIDEIVRHYEKMMKEANFHEYGDHKRPLVFFGSEKHIRGAEKIRCSECPAYMNADGRCKCWHAAKPGTETEPETECIYGITEVPEDRHMGFTLWLD